MIDMSAYDSGTSAGESTHGQNKQDDSTDGKTQSVTTTGAGAVAEYCYKMQGLYETLAECIDDTRDAEAAGDVAAAKEAKKRSDEAYFEVLNSTAPVEAKDVDIKMRTVAASMNLLAAFYNDATIAKAEGDSARYYEDLGEIITVIDDVNTDAAALGTALDELTAMYQ